MPTESHPSTSDDLTPDEHAIREREAARWAAVLANDVETFRTLAHPDFRYTHSTGRVDTLESYTAALAGPGYKFSAIDTPITEVLVAGDTAVVRAGMVADLVSGGVARHLDSVTTGVWTRLNGEWLLLAFQSTRSPDAA